MLQPLLCAKTTESQKIQQYRWTAANVSKLIDCSYKSKNGIPEQSAGHFQNVGSLG